MEETAVGDVLGEGGFAALRFARPFLVQRGAADPVRSRSQATAVVRTEGPLEGLLIGPGEFGDRPHTDRPQALERLRTHTRKQ
jgi:hypothetical protein